MNTSTQPAISAIKIIFKDEYIVVVNKPNNFIIHESHYARILEKLHSWISYRNNSAILFILHTD